MEEANQSSRPSEDFLRAIDPNGAHVVVSYCPRCGRFVAASPNLKVILIAEGLHTCHDGKSLPTQPTRRMLHLLGLCRSTQLQPAVRFAATPTSNGQNARASRSPTLPANRIP
jgi:hypothetical protein